MSVVLVASLLKALEGGLSVYEGALCGRLRGYGRAWAGVLGLGVVRAGEA